jgi:hypothetical protein
VVLAGVMAAVFVAATGSAHPHGDASFSLPFIFFFGFFWIRRGRRGWSHSRRGWRGGYPPHDQG